MSSVNNELETENNINNCKTPTRPAYNQTPNFVVPTNKIDLFAEKKKSTTNEKMKYFSKMGIFSNQDDSDKRSSSKISNHASDFSSNTCGINLNNQKELGQSEFENVQMECLELIKKADDDMSKLEFKKKFNTIKTYCKYTFGKLIIQRCCNISENMTQLLTF